MPRHAPAEATLRPRRPGLTLGAADALPLPVLPVAVASAALARRFGAPSRTR